MFFLGTHHPDWLETARVPLFISRRRLFRRKTLPKATHPWALDSGGFTELNLNGKWLVTPGQYVREIRRYQRIGKLLWAAPQDWMCEDQVLKKTGLTVRKHQRLTTKNFLQLRALAPDLPFIPVLQGRTPADYLRHADDYEKTDVDLSKTTVGVGSICRLQSTEAIVEIAVSLKPLGLRLHGFGLKTQGLIKPGVKETFNSSDSMAWSKTAWRAGKPMFKYCKTHKNCANCQTWALYWRHKLLQTLPKRWRHR